MAAEFGAHLTSSAVDSPSVFELLAQEHLQKSVRPAAEYLCKILAHKYPEKCGTLLHCFDELYTVLDVIIQHHYLKNYGSSFAEKFYGLKRVPEDGLNPEPKSDVHKSNNPILPRDHQVRSLACLVLVPYIKLKLDKEFEKQRENEADVVVPANAKWHLVRKTFLRIYPIFHLFWDGIMVAYLLAYVFGKFRYNSPLMHISRTTLRTLTDDDVSTVDSFSCKFQSLQHMRLIDYIPAAGMLLGKGLAVTISTGLSVGAFFMQFMEWYQYADYTPMFPKEEFVPPPPETYSSWAKNTDPRLCPLCSKLRKNDAALATSGYVFCYTCIHGYVLQRGKCPVTGYATSMDQLIRLYPPE